MAEERRLVATIIPKIDQQAIRDALKQAFSETLNVNLTSTALGGGGSGGGGGSSGTGVGAGTGGGSNGGLTSEDIRIFREAAQKQIDLYRTSNEMYDARKGLEKNKDIIGETEEGEAQMESDEQNRSNRLLSTIAGASRSIATGGISLMKKSFEFVELIYGKMKEASPLLQTIETLFNLAMTLFFMPLGNKLADMLIPATLELVDNVVNMWDAFDGKTLSEMFEYALDYGVKLFGQYFTDIGETLQGQEGLLGSIGDLIVTFGDFIQNNGVQVLTAIVKITDLVMSHLGTIITLIGAFYGFYVGYTMAKDALGFLSLIPGASLVVGGAGGLVGAMAGAAIGAGVSAYVGLPFAEGGHVDARPGGTPAIVGEGGEGEWIIPDSKMGNIGGGTYYYQFYGLTNDELIRMIDDRVNTQISLSKIKGGF